MSSDPPGFELPLRLLLAFRGLIDQLHRELAELGHPGLRPVHGYALQAVGPRGTTAAELGRALGVSKQAAGKTLDALSQLGYVTRGQDTRDRRRKVVVLTERGRDCLHQSGLVFQRLRQEWEERLGTERLRQLEEDLRTLTPEGTSPRFPLDAPGWLGGSLQD
ncbi:MarR family transcriptional regulator [Streptomyces sp. NPDC005438]|uniref:MarR family winged helix-turn-helix transcriptional regulator n=1 Tax=Streptomyces sp. NPDC005438 TaxID=3156880 RepID=UPI0033AA4023